MKQMCTWRCWVYKHCGARILSSIIADKFLEGLKPKFNVFFKELYGRAQKIDRNTGTSIQMNEASVLCRRYTSGPQEVYGASRSGRRHSSEGHIPICLRLINRFHRSEFSIQKTGIHSITISTSSYASPTLPI